MTQPGTYPFSARRSGARSQTCVPAGPSLRYAKQARMVRGGGSGDRFGVNMMAVLGNAPEAMRPTGRRLRRASEAKLFVHGLSHLTSTGEGADIDIMSRRAAEPPSRRAAEPPSRRAAEPPSRRAAEPPSRRAAEPPSRRAAEPPSRRAAEPPSRRAAGNEFSSCRCCVGPLASTPEPSRASRIGGLSASSSRKRPSSAQGRIVRRSREQKSASRASSRPRFPRYTSPLKTESGRYKRSRSPKGFDSKITKRMYPS